MGFFLIEIKSRPGRLFGDAGTWTWETDGKLSTVDNPLIAANLKAKKLGLAASAAEGVPEEGPRPVHRGPGLLLRPGPGRASCRATPGCGSACATGTRKATSRPVRGSWPP